MKIIDLIKETLDNTIKLSKYPNITILKPDSDYNENDDIDKIHIIKKYFNFKNVRGVIDYSGDDSIVNLKFDNNITIKGKWDSNSEIFDCVFNINNNEYKINFHPFASLGGIDLSEFEKSIKNIYQSENTFSCCIVHEEDVVHIIFTTNSLEEFNEKKEEYKCYIVKGEQLYGKQLGKTTSGESTYIKEIKL